MPGRSGGIQGDDWRKMDRNIRIVTEAGRKAMEEALPSIGLEATNIIKVMLTHPPVSLPGEPPGLRTGGLRLSYNYEVASAGPTRMILSIGSDAATRRPITGEPVDYAKFLEFGTADMAPRPHLRPAVAIVLPMIAPTLKAAAYAAQRAAAAGLRGTSL